MFHTFWCLGAQRKGMVIHMNQRTYLRWYNKLGYASGDLAAQMTNQLVLQFLMIFLTDSIGMDAAIIGTIMLVSNVLDAVTDLGFGILIDRTRTKLGRARPWMLYAQVGVSICLVALFSIPHGFSGVSQYVWFFVSYNLLNAIFYTAKYISYSTLISLITKNNAERVQCGTIRFVFSTCTSMGLGYIVVYLTPVVGWSMIAVGIAVAALIINTISVFSVHELPDEELYGQTASSEIQGPGALESIKLCLTNRYFLASLFATLLICVFSAFCGSAMYFFKYVMGNETLYATYNLFNLLPLAIAMFIAPFIVKKFGMWKPCVIGWGFIIVCRVLFMFAGYSLNFPMMMTCLVGYCIGCVPFAASSNPLLSEAATYTYYHSGKRIDAMIFSCSSLSNKLGAGVGSALYGMVLGHSGYDGLAAQQSETALATIKACFLVAPAVISVLIFICMLFLNVEKANRTWEEQHLSKE